MSGVVRGDTLVLRPGEGNGRSMAVDGRGRLYLPVWLRRHPGFRIGAHIAPEDPAVVIVPASVFDAMGDQLLERVR